MKNVVFASKFVLGIFVGLVLMFCVASAEAQLTISPLSIEGPPGDKREITLVTSARTRVSIGHLDDSFTRAGGTAYPTTGFGALVSTLTLPKEPGQYTVVATAGAITRAVNVTVTPLTLQIQSGNSQIGDTGKLLPDPLVVTVLDIHNSPVAGQVVTFTVTAGGGTLSAVTGRSDSKGRVQTFLTLGGLAGRNTVQASVVGSEPVLFTATAESPPGELKIHSGNNQTGPVNNPLPEPLVVQLLDAENKPIENYKVRFTITAGRGRFQPENMRTDVDGFARTSFTPLSNGTFTIKAEAIGVRVATFSVTTSHHLRRLLIVSGNNQTGSADRRLRNPLIVEVTDASGGPLKGIRVTFRVASGGGLLSREIVNTDVNGRAQTFLSLGGGTKTNTVTARITALRNPVIFTAFVEGETRTIGPVESETRIVTGQHPTMYWVDTVVGTLHRLVGSDIEDLVPGMQGVSSIAVDAAGGKIYWVRRAGANAGTIHGANLDGTGDVMLKRITSVPLSIAVDPTGGKLYWSNSRGRIQRSDLNGRRIQTPIKNQAGLKDIVLDVERGKIYWTERGGRIRRANLSNGRGIQNIATGLGEPMGITIAKAKIYWTEKTGRNAGKIQRANLNGSNQQTLKTLRNVPIGIGVDTPRNKLYWTNSQGRILRSNLIGRNAQTVVSGLVTPGSLVFETTTGVSTVTRQQTRTTTTYSIYDVNTDGAVDNVDVALVRAADGQTRPANPRLDVNKDGAVDILDLIAVVENRDGTGNAAPPVGIVFDLSAADRAVIQTRIDHLLATNDLSPAVLRTLAYLQNLLASARPDETLLLANYPNPFNPETWIPYHLATSTDVRINIYNAQGVLVRALTLGHQSAGYYTSRSRAAYWDGRNALR